MKKLTVGVDKEFQTIPDALNVASDGDVVWIDPGQYNLTTHLYVNKSVSFIANTDDPITNKVVIRWSNSGHFLLFYPQIDFVLFDYIYFEKISNVILHFQPETYFNPNWRCVFNGCTFNRTIYTTTRLQMMNTGVIGAYGIMEFNHCDINPTIYCDLDQFKDNSLINVRKTIGGDWANHSKTSILGIRDYVSSATDGYGPAYGRQTSAKYEEILKGEVLCEGETVPSDLFFYLQDSQELVARSIASAGGKFRLTLPGVMGEDIRGVSVFNGVIPFYNTSGSAINSYKVHNIVDNYYYLSDNSSTNKYVSIDLRREVKVSQIKLVGVYSRPSFHLFARVELSHSSDGITFTDPESFDMDFSQVHSNWADNCGLHDYVDYPHSFRYLKVNIYSSYMNNSMILSQVEVVPDVDEFNRPQAMVIDSMRTEEVLRLDARTTSRYREAVLNDLPQSYWRFNEYALVEGAIDFVGGNNGAYLGVTPKLNRDGGIDSDEDTSIHLTGDARIEVPHFQIRTPCTFEGYVSSEDFNEATPVPVLFSGDADHIFVSLRVESRKFIFETIRDDNGTPESWVLETPPFIKKVRWNYFAISISVDNEVVIFFNGTPLVSGTCPFDIQDLSFPLWFGRDMTSYIQGYLDEFVYYSKLLLPDKVYNHYSVAGNPLFDYYVYTLLQESPQQYWRLEEEFGGTALNHASPIPDDYIAYYTLDGDVEDQSAEVYDGFLNQCEYYTDRFSAADKAVFLTNDLSYIEFPHTVLLNREALSVALWFRTPGNSSQPQTLICGSRSGDLHSLLIYLDDTGIPQFLLNTIEVAGSGNSLNDNQWHSLVVTRDDVIPEMNIYVDGSLVGTGAEVSSLLFINNHGLRVGGRPVGLVGDANEAGWSLNGTVDDIRFYQRVLTLEEVQEIATDGSKQINGSYQGLITPGEPGALQYSATKCPLFGGFNGRIELPGMRLKNGNTAFTVGFWVRSENAPRSTLYSEYTDDFEQNRIITIDSRIHINIRESEFNNSFLSSVSKVNDNEWHQVFIIYDGANCSIYVDTRMEVTKPMTIEDCESDFAYLGCQNEEGTLNFGFIGYIDEAIYYDSILSQGTIELQYERSNRELPILDSMYPTAVKGADAVAHFRINDDVYMEDRLSNLQGLVTDMNRIPSVVNNTDDEAYSNLTGNIQVVNADPILFEGAFSIECWITFKTIDTSIGTDAPQIIDCYERVGGDNSRGYKLGLAMMSKNKLDFTVCDTMMIIENINQNQLYYLVGVFDGSQMHFYVDGVQQPSKVAAPPKKPEDTTMYLGSSRNKDSLECDFEQLAFYDYALTPEEIALRLEIGT